MSNINTEDSFRNAGEDAQVIGVHTGNKIILTDNGKKRFYCTNCRNNIHAIAGAKEGEPVEVIRNLCSNDNCQCRCVSHYIARNGKLKKLGTIDKTKADEDGSANKQETDDMIKKINKQFRKNNEPDIVEPISDDTPKKD